MSNGEMLCYLWTGICFSWCNALIALGVEKKMREDKLKRQSSNLSAIHLINWSHNLKTTQTGL